MFSSCFFCAPRPHFREVKYYVKIWSQDGSATGPPSPVFPLGRSGWGELSHPGKEPAHPSGISRFNPFLVNMMWEREMMVCDCSTAARAGRKQPPPPSPTGSRLRGKPPGRISILLHRFITIQHFPLHFDKSLKKAGFAQSPTSPPTQLSWQFWQCQVCQYHWLAGPPAPKMILLVWDRAYIVSGVWWVGQSPNELLQNWQSHELRRTITRRRSSLLSIKIRLMHEP